MGSIPQVSVLRGATRPLPRVCLLSRLYEEKARNNPGATAVIYKGITGAVHKLSYSELDRAANCLARAIVSRVRSGTSGGDLVVAVSLPPSDALLLTLLAIWKAGAAYLPLDQQASNRVQHILSEAKPQLVITEESEDKLDSVLRSHNTVSFATLDAEAAGKSDGSLAEEEMLPSTSQPLALVLYTSGSTGVPKGVRLPHAVVLNRLCWQWREFPYGQTERVCVFKTTLTFVDAVCEIWGPLLHEIPISLLVVPREITKDPQRLIPLLDEYQVERLLVVPTLLRAILLFLTLDKTYKLQNLKTWVCSGEPLAVSLAQQFLDHFHDKDVSLCNFYGSTEVMGDVTFHVIRSHDDLAAFDKVPIGRPVDNTTIYLLDKQLSVVPVGEVGEIYVAGLNVCAGYINNRDPHKFISNNHTVDPDMSRLYHTGDYGRLVKGTVLYEGRTDSQVKVRGHRVDLAEVDAALSKLPQVEKAAVLCYKPGEVDQMVIAYVTLHSDQKCSGEEIEKALLSHLAIYAIPQVIVVDSIPLLNNGKVDRQTLLKRYAEMGGGGEMLNIDLDLAGVKETDVPTAKCLLLTVAAVLGGAARGRVSLDSNFYHLGGNSLNSVYTVTKLRDQGYLIGITDFISAKNLRHVLEKMEPEEEAKEDNIISSQTQKPYIREIISNKHKSDVYRIITDSFYSKGDLEQCIQPRIPRQDYHELLDKIWEPLIAAELSFVLLSRATGQIVSVALSFDAHDEPPVQLSGGLTAVFDFLEFVEAPIRDYKLPQGKGRVLHAFMMGTEQSLSAAENVLAMQTMEEEVLSIATARGFAGIFTTNTSPLTKQLGTDVFNYKVMSEYQANQYVASNGSRPFSRASDELRVYCSWKQI
ncbi:beta-alanyl-bioamine nonribosomal peptide synthetase ebony [Macrosteles quadrilineatus]|uniref:beta-alanyl-bioamine nonribosomal peptide synthetase ebony n=1 Tax=Macrosteles quadrilineatus TaxID=74068 RepID=UPI0023E0C5E4|nr:beta-alanyl-bioamine nonribosomal peptide synthetase ebony [Macrosteles quadrilineatus]